MSTIYFKQTRLFNTVKVELQAEGLHYFYGNIINNEQLFVEYDDIFYKKVNKQVKTDKFNLFVCILSGLTVLKSLLGIYSDPNGIYRGLLPVSAIFFLVFLVVTILGRTKFLFIETLNGKAIKLFYNKPNEVEFNSFLKNLDQKVKNYLRAKYTVIDSENTTEIQLENLFWLKKHHIISVKEYENLKKQCLANSEVNIIN